MQTRTRKALSATTALAAIAVSVPLAVTAHGDPETPAPVAPIPDPQGPACDAYKKEVPSGPGSVTGMADEPVGTAIASNPQLTTFSSAISGGLNPEVNIVPVLENGPYVVFAPTDEAFAKLPPEQLEAYKTDAAALYKLVYYHEFLGLLGPDDVKGQRPTQQGGEMKVTGKGGEIVVNDIAKVTCGGFQTANARIYMIDTVLDPDNPPAAITPTPTSSDTTTTTTTTTTTSPPEG